MNNKLTIDEIQSKAIDWLRFPLIIAVVFIHMNPKVNMKEVDYTNLSMNNIYSIIGTLGSKLLPSIAVPTFFLFSGYLFFYKLKEWNLEVYQHKIKSRIKTLMIPYLMWNIIPVIVYTLFRILKYNNNGWEYLQEVFSHGFFSIFWDYHTWGKGENILGWATASYGPFNLPLWFLRDLIVVTLLSPLVYYFVKYTKFYGILFLSILYCFKIWLTIPGFSVKAFFFFSFGAYFSIYAKNMVAEFRKVKWLWSILALVSVGLSLFFVGTKINRYSIITYVIFGTITAINIASYLIEYGKVTLNNTLAKSTFFIYATHTSLILSLVNGTYDSYFKPTSDIAAILKYLIVPLLTTGVCLGLFFLMKRYTPKALTFLTGSR